MSFVYLFIRILYDIAVDVKVMHLLKTKKTQLN